MLQLILAYSSTAAAVAAFVFAGWKGGPPERIGAAVIAGGWFLAMFGYAVASRATASYQVAPYVGFGADGVVALGLLVLALRYSSLWLGLAVLLQAGELALHAAFLTGDGSGARTYISRVNLLGAAIIVLLVAATLNVWIRRLRRQRHESRDGRRSLSTEAAAAAAAPGGANRQS